MSKHVIAVVYGEEVHLYDLGDWRADSVYIVAIGANLDAEKFTFTAETWDKTHQRLRRDIPECQIFDHR